MKEKKLVNQARLDLACGQNKTEGYFGIDIFPGETVDAAMDLEQFPWPIESNSAEDIVCNHYVEHTKDLIKFMDEVYRILKPGGKMRIVAPYYTSMRCWQDPTHTRAISEATFLYYNKDWRKANKLDHYNITCDFDYNYGYALYPEWISRSEEAKAFALKHYNNVASDIIVTMTKKAEPVKE